MRVLLVEDDRMIGAAVAEALKDAAYATDWVQDGELAMEAIRSETRFSTSVCRSSTVSTC
jgi:two-component system OmpR family response regulator